MDQSCSTHQDRGTIQDHETVVDWQGQVNALRSQATKACAAQNTKISGESRDLGSRKVNGSCEAKAYADQIAGLSGDTRQTEGLAKNYGNAKITGPSDTAAREGTR